ncbi:Gfo/Idh/MocA family protein [Catellatospora methionotrophica]|uniref:Gfo/Idh/MocA family protein n=1 Tax=Catellatospora methionotrophica TaxID=121620 RepID=UPI003411BF41
MRCVVVGWGAVSRIMLRALDATDWYETSAVVDVRPEALDDVRATRPGVAGFTGLSEALAAVEPDAVIINTPSHLHYEQVVPALEAGAHVLVAKPITNDFDQAAALVGLADRLGLTLSVGQQMRFMRHYQALGRFLADGGVGSVESVNLLNSKPRPHPANLTGMAQPALYEMACHHFDSLAALLPGAVPESIACDGFTPSWSKYDGPCTVNGLIRYSGGVHVLYQGGFSAQAPNYEVRVDGSTGAVRCRGQHMSIDTMTNEYAPAGKDFGPSDLDRDFPAVNPWDVFAAQWRDYVDGGTEPAFSARRNLPVVALLSAGIDSIAQGGAPVAVRANPRYAAAFAEGSQA